MRDRSADRDGTSQPATNGRLAGESALSGLMAIAVVRRLLLDQNGGEEPDGSAVAGQPLEIWVVRPLDDFGGLSPAQVLGRAGGMERLGAWLRQPRNLAR